MHALLMQQPIMKQAKHSRPQMSSSHGPGVTMQVGPVAVVAMLLLTATEVLDTAVLAAVEFAVLEASVAPPFGAPPLGAPPLEG
jgi:hypothetical protein